MGLWKDQNPFTFEKAPKMMELYIETLTGTAFELRVSPYETVQDVKARIQKLEGIPISQQNLIWQTLELDDDYSLQEYGIQDGSTLKLVLTMRGGPINTRRVPVEDASLREMAEYLSEAQRDEFPDKPGGNRPVTVIVYHNGDQLNFFRVVDRDAQSPMSESLSGASMYNLYDDDEEDLDGAKEKMEENDRTKDKMKIIRSKLETMNLTKKGITLMHPHPPETSKKSPSPPQLVPHPPSSGRPHSMSKLRRFPSSSSKNSLLNRNTCLPPVGQIYMQEDGKVISPNTTKLPRSFSQFLQKEASSAGETSESDTNAKNIKLDADTPSKGNRMPLTSVIEDEPPEEGADIKTAAEQEAKSTNQKEVLEAILRRAHSVTRPSPRKWDLSQEVLLRDSSAALKKQTEGPKNKENSNIDSVGDSKRPLTTTSTRGLERLWSETSETSITTATGGAAAARPLTSSKREMSLETLPEKTFTKPSTARRERRSGSRGVVLETLNPSEVRAMSGLLSSYVQRSSASKTPRGMKDGGRRTPEGRLLSARLSRLSGGRDGRLSPRLAPIKHKKKNSKRCFMCGKKTGLATSYQCRCGENFCANHRYAESHSCTFDYKTEGRKLLQQSNPVVTAPKLPKI